MSKEVTRQTGRIRRQHKFIEQLIKHNGIVLRAAEATGVTRECHYRWRKEDPWYKKATDEIDEIVLDLAEEKLFKRISKEDTAAIIFLLKSRGESRGYSPRSSVKHEGEIQHKHRVVQISHEDAMKFLKDASLD